MNPLLPELKPLAIKHRVAYVFVEKCLIDMKDGAFVAVDETGIRTHIPVGSVSCIFLQPGTRISHAAVHLAAVSGTMLQWVGEGGVRLYSAGQPGGASAEKLLYQAGLFLNDQTRLLVVRKMFDMRFGAPAPEKRSVRQLQGIEGARVKQMYTQLARSYGLEWSRRSYNVKNWDSGDLLNRCVSTATSCLYGVCEAAIIAAGYSPAIGFIHSGDSRSFVFDIADIYKFDTVLPIAFSVAKTSPAYPEREVRQSCRNFFHEKKLLKRIIPDINDIFAASEKTPPPLPEDTIPPAIPAAVPFGDVGHRNKKG